MPAGKRTDRTTGRVHRLAAFQFDGAECRACPLRSRCIAAKGRKGRRVLIHPQEALLQKARALQQSTAYDEYRALRVVVEHRLARLVQLGIRQSRYFGLAKTQFQLYLAATVANLTLVLGNIGLSGSTGGDPESHSVVLVVIGLFRPFNIIDEVRAVVANATVNFGAVRPGQLLSLILFVSALLLQLHFQIRAVRPEQTPDVVHPGAWGESARVRRTGRRCKPWATLLVVPDPYESLRQRTSGSEAFDADSAVLRGARYTKTARCTKDRAVASRHPLASRLSYHWQARDCQARYWLRPREPERRRGSAHAWLTVLVALSACVVSGRSMRYRIRNRLRMVNRRKNRKITPRTVCIPPTAAYQAHSLPSSTSLKNLSFRLRNPCALPKLAKSAWG